MSKIVLNPRLVKIYELLRGFGLSTNQATKIATKTYESLPENAKIPTESEIEDLAKGRT